jgi:hypothetical protein
VSELAPFTAALVGAGIAVISRGGMPARVIGPAAIGAGIVTELIVIGKYPSEVTWAPALLIVVGGMAAVMLALGPAITRQVRTAALIAGVGVLLLAPGAWAFETLGHPTSGTFPAGGPDSASLGGLGGPGGGPGGGRFGGGPPGGGGPGGAGFPGANGFGQQGGGQGGLAQGTLPPGLSQGGSAQGGSAQGSGGGFGGGQAPGFGGGSAQGFGPGGSAQGFGGGPFGGNTQSLTEALAYVKRHGGGTIAVSSQSGAAGQLIANGADVAAIGGFSGRESQVSVSWLADAVEQGRIRWVLTDGSGGGFQDGRIGASLVMDAVQKVGTQSSSVSGLYDLKGHAAELRALGRM